MNRRQTSPVTPTLPMEPDYTAAQLHRMWLEETGATPAEIEEAMNETDDPNEQQ
jgi:hypothetical protein